MVNYRGTAESLTIALESKLWTLAIIILYLLISAMFQSFKDSLLVIATITNGNSRRCIGNSADEFNDRANKMDLLTMIGFIILLWTGCKQCYIVS